MKILTTLRAARSLIAGILIGGSIVVTVFAVTVASPSATQTVLVIAAAMVLVLGFTLQMVVTRPSLPRRTNAFDTAASRITIMEADHAHHFGAAPRALLAG